MFSLQWFLMKIHRILERAFILPWGKSRKSALKAFSFAADQMLGVLQDTQLGSIILWAPTLHSAHRDGTAVNPNNPGGLDLGMIRGYSLTAGGHLQPGHAGFSLSTRGSTNIRVQASQGYLAWELGGRETQVVV